MRAGGFRPAVVREVSRAVASGLGGRAEGRFQQLPGPVIANPTRALSRAHDLTNLREASVPFRARVTKRSATR